MADIAVERPRREHVFTTSRATAAFDHTSHPICANQAMKVDQVPRSFTVGKMSYHPRRSAMVEDEATSLAREHGCPPPDPLGDEPRCPGDPCQEPLLIEVTEPKSNSERRYVLLKRQDSDSTDTGEANDGVDTYEKVEVQANISLARRPSTSSRCVDQGAGLKPLNLRRPKSRLELPRFDTTDFQREDDNSRPKSSARSRSSYRNTCVKQEPQDYFAHIESPRLQADGLGSQTPVVIKHSTKGRHRAYFDLCPSNNEGFTRSPREIPRSYSDRPKNGDRFTPRLATSTSPATPRRLAVNPPPYFRTTSDRGSVPPREMWNAHISKHSISSSSSIDGNYPASPRRDRLGSSPPQDSPYFPLTTESSRRRGQDEHSIDDEPRSSRRSTRRESFRRSMEERNSLLSPTSAVASTRDRSRPRMTNPSTSASYRLSREIPSDIRPIPILSPRGSSPQPPTPRSRGRNRQDSPPSSRSPSPSQSVRSRDDRPRGMRPMSRVPASPATEYSTSLPVRTPITAGPLSAFDHFSQPSPRPPPSPRNSVDSTPSLNHPPPVTFTRGESTCSVNSTSRSKRPRPYLDYAKDVAYGKVEALPDCHRVDPSSGAHTWYTFRGQPELLDSVSICTGCHDAMFAESRFQSQLVPVHRPSHLKTACSVGNSHWYRIAWVLTHTHKLDDLRLLHDVGRAAIRTSSCPGHYPTRREWLSIIDPKTSRPVADFSVCTACANAVGALLPRLKGAFRPTSSDKSGIKDTCALRGYPETRRFVRFFDALETADDRALNAGTKRVDSALLSKLLIDVTTFSECNEDTEVDNRAWHQMRSIPDFRVCQECFIAVVRPQIAAGSLVAQDFERQPRVLKRAACQLYSKRMRDVFGTACDRGDLGYLADRVRERKMLRERFVEMSEREPLSGKAERERFRAKLEGMLADWTRYE